MKLAEMPPARTGAAIVPSMKSTSLVLFCLFLGVPLGFAQSFTVTFAKEISAAPFDGRLLLLLSTNPDAEPRMQIDDTPGTQMAFGMNVDGWQPGQAATVDASAW